MTGCRKNRTMKIKKCNEHEIILIGPDKSQQNLINELYIDEQCDIFAKIIVDIFIRTQHEKTTKSEE